MLVSVKEHKIAVVGPRKVGKSALVVRFLTKRFICEYAENTDMSWRRETTVEGEHLKVFIRDTSDDGLSLSAIDDYFHWADGIIMIYSITDAEGFQQLKFIATKMVEKIADLDEKEQSLVPPLVLMGNKGDLEFARKVSRSEGYELSRKLRCEFFEGSAREGWSKFLSPSSPSQHLDPTSIFISASKMTRSSSHNVLFKPPASPKRKSSPSRFENFKGFEKNKNNTPVFQDCRRSPGLNRRSGRSFSLASSGTSPVPAVPNMAPRLNSFPVASTFSEEENDEIKSCYLTPNRGRKLSTHEKLIGRLSPRLGRKLIKTSKADEHNNHHKDTNNNHHRNNLSHDRLTNGHSAKSDSKLKVIPDEYNVPQIKICCHGSSSSSTGSSSSANSVYGSTDSLPMSELDKDDHALEKQSPESPSSPTEVFRETFHEQEFTSSEPFLFICRMKPLLEQVRPRSRSPSHRLMNGLKKIRSLAGDHSSGHGNGLVKHQSSSTLLLPTLKF